MKAIVQAILERELNKLNTTSALSDQDGLKLADVKRLETLIRCYQNFIGKPDTHTETSAPDTPASQTTEDLLKDLQANG